MALPALGGQLWSDRRRAADRQAPTGHLHLRGSESTSRQEKTLAMIQCTTFSGGAYSVSAAYRVLSNFYCGAIVLRLSVLCCFSDADQLLRMHRSGNKYKGNRSLLTCAFGQGAKYHLSPAGRPQISPKPLYCAYGPRYGGFCYPAPF